jgi:hypothetical protein
MRWDSGSENVWRRNRSRDEDDEYTKEGEVAKD